MKPSTARLKEQHIYYIQILFISGVILGLQTDLEHWPASIARYVVYIITMEATNGISAIMYDMFHEKSTNFMARLAKLDIPVVVNRAMLFLLAFAIVYIKKQTILSEDFPIVFIAYLIMKHPSLGSSKTTISYGAGMACSLYEGYLKHVLPSDGQGFGFEENVRNYESEHGVVFPVKRMFLIITKSYYCPPDLGNFNKGDKNLSYLEAVRSLEKVVKDVAGVKNRAYRNAVYRVYRAGGRGGRPLCVAAECATPLHTLYGVLANRDLADELLNLDVPATVEEFCTTLRHILDKSAAVKDKCELVYFDDTDKKLNLADVLLDRMKEINSDFDDW